MKDSDFLHVDTNSYKLKVSQKSFWWAWLQDSKIDPISGMNRWSELIFCMLVKIQES